MQRETGIAEQVAPSTGLVDSPPPERLPKVVRPPNERPLVLSVDDDEVNQEVIENALSEMCELVRAMDGSEALQCLRERRRANQCLPDLVLLDIQMPGMTGFQVCEEIRKSFEADHTKMPIIMVSARSPADQTALQCFDKGSTDFLCKPFNTEVLRRKVQVALKVKEESLVSGNAALMLADPAEQLGEAVARTESAEKRAELAAQSMRLAELKSEELSMQLARAQQQLQQVRSGCRMAASVDTAPPDPVAKKGQRLPMPAGPPSKGQVIQQQPAPELKGHGLRQQLAAELKGQGLQQQLLEEQKAMGQLSHQVFSSKAVVGALRSHLEIVRVAAIDCQVILSLPYAAPVKPMGCHDDKFAAKLRSRKSTAGLLCSQFRIMEQLAAQSMELAFLPLA